MATDNSFATTSLVCALFSWVPLFNYALIPVGIITGILGVMHARGKGRPGLVRAIIGLTIAVVWVVLFVIGFLLYGIEPFLRR